MTHRRGFLASLLGLIGLGTVKASPQLVSSNLSHGVIGPTHFSIHHWTTDEKGRVVDTSQGWLDFSECPEQMNHQRDLFPEIDSGFARIRSDYHVDKTGCKIRWKCVDVEVVA